MPKTNYDVKEIHLGFWIINIARPDGSRHLMGGYKTKDEADADVRIWTQRAIERFRASQEPSYP